MAKNQLLATALRKLLNSKSEWSSRESFGEELTEFSNSRGQSRRFGKEEIDGIVTRRKGCKDETALLIRLFLAQKGYFLDPQQNRFIDIHSEDYARLIRHSGTYQFFYSVTPNDLLKGEKFFSSRILKIDVSMSNEINLGGSFHSYEHAPTKGKPKVAKRGWLEIDGAGADSDMLLIRCMEEEAATPPLSLLLRFVEVRGTGFFYGLGTGYQTGTKDFMTTTKVIGVPDKLLGLTPFKRIYREQNADIFDLLEKYLRGRSPSDTPETLTSSLEFFAYDSENNNFAPYASSLPTLFEAFIDCAASLQKNNLAKSITPPDLL